MDVGHDGKTRNIDPGRMRAWALESERDGKRDEAARWRQLADEQEKMLKCAEHSDEVIKWIDAGDRLECSTEACQIWVDCPASPEQLRAGADSMIRLGWRFRRKVERVEFVHQVVEWQGGLVVNMNNSGFKAGDLVSITRIGGKPV